MPLPASHPLFVSYTSGSTGKPKGVVHVHGGYMYGVALSMETVFEITITGADKGKGKDAPPVMLTLGTTGWITGQSYMVAGPLISGTKAILLGGSPIYPDLLRLVLGVGARVAVTVTGWGKGYGYGYGYG